MKRMARAGSGERNVREGDARVTVRLRFRARILLLPLCALRTGRAPVSVRTLARLYTRRCRHEGQLRREPCGVDRVLTQGKGNCLLEILVRKNCYFSDR